MRTVSALLLAFLFGAAFLPSNSDAQIITYEQVLNDNPAYPYYIVRWTVDYDEETVAFQVEVETTSYVGLGISARGTMVGSDITIGGVLVDGRPYFGDYHGTDQGTPPLDQSQDYTLTRSMENGTHTVLEFWRRFDTGDANDDKLTATPTNFIWAVGGYDPIIPDDILVFHGPFRGISPVRILDPDHLPPPDPCEPVNPVEKEIQVSEDFHVRWYADLDTQMVDFFLTVRSTGYVGLGFNENPTGMSGADIFIGGAYENRSAYFGDYYSLSQGVPTRDPIQNYIPTGSFTDNGTHTSVQFSRAFETGDGDVFDYNPISDRPVYLIWATGATDDLEHHGGSRGQVMTTILEPLPEPCLARARGSRLRNRV